MATATGRGLLLGNPHYPWEGELRVWESHLMIPGELNVYGVGLSRLSGIQIGFNDAVARTHTVSADTDPRCTDPADRAGLETFSAVFGSFVTQTWLSKRQQVAVGLAAPGCVGCSPLPAWPAW